VISTCRIFPDVTSFRCELYLIIKWGIYLYNPDILAEDVFEYQRVQAVNGGDGARRAEDTADSCASTSTATCLRNYRLSQ
jgi:hypothetical protein